MPALPDKVNSSQSFVKLANRRFILLLFLALLILLFIVFFLLKARPQILTPQNKTLSGFLEGFKSQTSSLEFPSDLWRQRLIETYPKVLVENDRAKQFESLSASFDVLGKIYALKPTQKTRESLQNLKDFLKSNYKEFYQEEKFPVSCIDDACSIPEPPKDIEEISTRVNNLAVLDESVKQNVFLSIKRASASKERGEQWSQYDAAFQLLNSEFKKNKNTKELREILEKLASFIRENYQQEYQFILKVEGAKNHYNLD